MSWLQSIVPAALAAIVAMMVTPAVARLAIRLSAVDAPGGRKQHTGSPPRLGGLGIAFAIVIALVPSLLLLTRNTLKTLSSTEILWFLFAALIVFALGLVDDIVGLGPFKKLIFQTFAAAIVVAIGWQLNAVRVPWGEGTLDVSSVAPLLSVLWIVGVTNAINFIDGLDGLAAGVVAVIATSLLFLGLLQGSPEMVVVSSCVAGACLGFLRHNWQPAKVYMGDSGSLLLGFVLATVSLRVSVKASAAVAILVPILALGLPVFDTLMVMWYRFLRGHPRTNRIARMFHADRKHLHHLLLEASTDRRRVTLTLYALALAFCLMALLVAASGNLWMGLGFLVVEVAAVVLTRAAGVWAARANEPRRSRRAPAEEPAARDRTPAGGRETAEPVAK